MSEKILLNSAATHEYIKLKKINKTIHTLPVRSLDIPAHLLFFSLFFTTFYILDTHRRHQIYASKICGIM